MLAREQHGFVQVKALIRHPMETGHRRNPDTRGVWPEYFITEGVARVNGDVILEMQWGTAISKNPFLSFRFHGQKGDRVDLWLVDKTQPAKSPVL